MTNVQTPMTNQYSKNMNDQMYWDFWDWDLIGHWKLSRSFILFSKVCGIPPER